MEIETLYKYFDVNIARLGSNNNVFSLQFIGKIGDIKGNIYYKICDDNDLNDIKNNIGIQNIKNEKLRDIILYGLSKNNNKYKIKYYINSDALILPIIYDSDIISFEITLNIPKKLTEIETIRHELKNMRDTLSDTKQEISNKNTDINSLTETLSDPLYSLNNLKDKLNEAKQQLLDMNALLDDIKQEYKSKSDTLDELTQDISDMKQQLIELKDNILKKESTPSDEAHSDGLSVKDLDAMDPENRRNAIGVELYPKVHAIEPTFAAKITGMLLELDTQELLTLIRDKTALQDKIDEAISVLNNATFNQDELNDSDAESEAKTEAKSERPLYLDDIPMPEVSDDDLIIHEIKRNILTIDMLDNIEPIEAKRMIGEKIWPKVNQIHPKSAEAITDMLLAKMDNAELLELLDDSDKLLENINDAANVINQYSNNINKASANNISDSDAETKDDISNHDTLYILQ